MKTTKEMKGVKENNGVQGMKGINAVLGNEWMKGFNEEPLGVGDRHGGGGGNEGKVGAGI